MAGPMQYTTSGMLLVQMATWADMTPGSFSVDVGVIAFMCSS